jgi:hypothetical protein
MFFHMRLCSLFGMMSAMGHVAARAVSVMCCLLMASCFVMLRSLGMMFRGVGVVLGSLFVMFRCFFGHRILLFVATSARNWTKLNAICFHAKHLKAGILGLEATAERPTLE